MMEHKRKERNKKIVHNIGFGSCNRQNLPQHHWLEIESLISPEIWLWMGDAYYSKNNSVEGLIESISVLTQDSHYYNFSENTIVDGIWDDHDYGVNDAGRLISNYSARKELFQRFLTHGQRFHHSQSENLYHHIDIDIASVEGINEKSARRN